jgi:circadian clock protein KaiB
MTLPTAAADVRPRDGVDMPAAEDYILRLYVAGFTTLSIRAVTNVRKLCEDYLGAECDLKVINICEHPELAATAQLFAAPTLVKEFPLPARRFVGDMSRTDLLMNGLGVRAAAGRPAVSG